MQEVNKNIINFYTRFLTANFIRLIAYNAAPKAIKNILGKQSLLDFESAAKIFKHNLENKLIDPYDMFNVCRAEKDPQKLSIYLNILFYVTYDYFDATLESHKRKLLDVELFNKANMQLNSFEHILSVRIAENDIVAELIKPSLMDKRNQLVNKIYEIEDVFKRGNGWSCAFDIINDFAMCVINHVYFMWLAVNIDKIDDTQEIAAKRKEINQLIEIEKIINLTKEELICLRQN